MFQKLSVYLFILFTKYWFLFFSLQELFKLFWCYLSILFYTQIDFSYKIGSYHFSDDFFKTILGGDGESDLSTCDSP